MSLPPKVAPPPLAARGARPAAIRLRGLAVKIIAAVAAVVLSGAFTYAFILEPAAGGEAAGRPRKPSAAGGVRPSEVISGQPASYDRLAPKLPPPRTEPPAPAQPEASEARPLAGPPARSPSQPAPEPDIAQAARASGLFFAARASGTAPRGQLRGASAPGPASEAEAADVAEAYSPHGLIAPLSPFELKAGTLVPAALLTAVDTGRPGPVLAVTTQPVFDTVTGRIELLPQGARLIGVQQGDSAYGERRAHVIWKRLILPNGKSLLLQDEVAADAAGATGLPGEPERRLLQTGGAALLSAAVSTIGEISRGGGGRRRGSLREALGDALAGQAAELGGRLLDRELDVRPRVVVGAGAPLNVLITKDLILEPVS